MAAKIKDGLFIGDAETSQDPEFLELNKISNLVNLAGREVQNVWATHGLVYLTYNWEDRPDFELFDGSDEAIKDLTEFVDASIRHGVAVLLFSRRGTGRSSVAICAYLMSKYHWGFEKTYDFVYSKKPDIEINQGFIRQLFALDKRLRANRNQQLKFQADDPSQLLTKESMRAKDWDPLYLEIDIEASRYSASKSAQASRGKKDRDIDCIEETPDDELLLINSFLNSKQTISSLPGPFRNAIDIPKAFKIRFNSELQEEDIHMLPTSPPRGRDAVPRRGAIKGKYAYSSSSSTASSGENQSSNSRRVSSGVGSRGDSEYIDYPGDGMTNGVDHGRNEEKLQSGSRSFRGGSAQSSAVYDDQDLGSAKDQPQYYSNSGSSSSLRRGSYESEDKYSTGSNGVSGRGGGGDDLYRFIGLGSEGVSDPRSRKQPPPGPGQGQGQAQASSADERLRHLVANMHIGNGGQSSSTGGNSSRGGPGSAGSASGQKQRSNTPTLYDLATGGAAVGAANSLGRSRRADDQADKAEGPPGASDPLAAFELMQQQQRGGAVRVRHDVVIDFADGPSVGSGRGGGRAPPPQRVPPSQVRGAWMDDAPGQQSGTGGSGGARKQQPVPGMRPSSAHRSGSPIPGGGPGQGGGGDAGSTGSRASSGRGDPQQSQGPRTYRHGSPAPSRLSTTGTNRAGSGGGMGQQPPSRFTMGTANGASGGAGSIASVSSIGSLGSSVSAVAGTGYGGPIHTTGGTRDMGGKSAPQRQPSPAQRRGSAGSERDRPPSPGPGAAARRAVAGPNPSPMRGGLGSSGRVRAGSNDYGTDASLATNGSAGMGGAGAAGGSRSRAPSPGPGGGGGGGGGVSASLGAYASSLGIDLSGGGGGGGAGPRAGASSSGTGRSGTPTRGWKF